MKLKVRARCPQGSTPHICLCVHTRPDGWHHGWLLTLTLIHVQWEKQQDRSLWLSSLLSSYNVHEGVELIPALPAGSKHLSMFRNLFEGIWFGLTGPPTQSTTVSFKIDNGYNAMVYFNITAQLTLDIFIDEPFWTEDSVVVSSCVSPHATSLMCH